MLVGDLFFAWCYELGIAPWLHTLAGLLILAVGLIAFGLLWIRFEVLRRIRQAFRWRIIIPSTIGAVLLLAGYVVWGTFRPVPVVPGASRDSVVYLDTALWYLEHYYLHSDQIDWAHIREVSFDRIKGAQTPSDTYIGIHEALVLIGDRHTQLIPANWKAEPDDLSKIDDYRRQILETKTPEGRLTSGNIGYVLVPWFQGTGSGPIVFLDKESKAAYVDRMRQILIELDNREPCGWILDLRKNPGGNMWPMLDGLAPLIGEGRVFSNEMPQFGRRTDTWIIGGRASYGAPFLGGLGLWGPGKLDLKKGHAPIAILIGKFTASAGEALVVSFSGRPDTRTFGTPTFGATTSTQGVSLSDGAELYITIGREIDRNGRSYESQIEPDETVDGVGEADDSPPIVAASNWIRSKSQCR